MALPSLKILIIILIVSNDCRLSFGLGISDIQDIANFANDAWGVLKGELPLSTLLTGSTGPTIDQILGKTGDISKKLDKFGTQFSRLESRFNEMSDKLSAQLTENTRQTNLRFDEVNEKLEKLLIQIPLKGERYHLMQQLHSYVVRVDYLYEMYERYSVSRDRFNNYTIGSYIEAVTSIRRGELDDLLNRIYRLLIPVNTQSKLSDGIFEILAKYINETVNLQCGNHVSPQTKLFQVYESIMMTETRGYIMSLFAYSLLSIMRRTSFEAELEHVKDRFIDESDQFLKIVAKMMTGLSPKIERCNSGKYNYLEDYAELESYYHADLSHRSISSKEQIADIENNMVVTGVRFAWSKTRLIEYQIRQGYLLQQGLVDYQNESWKELPLLSFSKNSSEQGEFTLADDGTPFTDIIPLNKTATSQINIDDIILPHGYIVCGIDLELIDKEIFLRVYSVKFNFTTGKLDTSDAKWITVRDLTDLPEIYKNARKKRSDIGKKYPTLSQIFSIDSSPNDQYIFGLTTGEGTYKRMVPVFDIRNTDIESPAIALNGIGLYHRGSMEYGGYLNFRLWHIDLSKYIKS